VPPGGLTSDLSTAGFAALQSVGLDPVGQVMGSCVWHFGYLPYACGARSGVGASVQTQPVRSYAASLRTARATALLRLREQCVALGGHGVVNVHLEWSRFHGVNRTQEITATGTAVRVRSATHPRYVFTAALPGQDVASLLQAGWAACAVAYGVSVAARHDPLAGRVARRRNGEVRSLTDLTTTARRWCRDDLRGEVRSTGGRGAVLGTQGLTVWHHEPAEGHSDHLVIATLIGTALVRVPRKGGAPAAPAPLSMLRLSTRPTARSTL